MKRLFLALMLLAGSCLIGYAQDAKTVLEKCAASVSAKSGVQAEFSMNSAQYGNSSGKISVKGKMFTATTSMATLWFDGKTLWTYMSNNDEVNVTTPSESQLQVMNPYNFINMYKKGYRYSMTQSGNAYQVHLTATDTSKRVSEMFITVDKKTYHPTEVKLLQKQKWTTFTINNLKIANLSDATFKFNSKDFPSAEIIDLR